MTTTSSSKTDIRKLSVLVGFYDRVFCFVLKQGYVQKLNHYQRRKMQTEFPWIKLNIIFWPFTVFDNRFDSTQAGLSFEAGNRQLLPDLWSLL